MKPPPNPEGNMPEEIILGADVTDIPAPAVEGGAEPAPEPAAQPDQPQEFSSLFRAAHEKATAEPEPAAAEPKPDEPAPAEDDDTIPDDDADADKPDEVSETADEIKDTPADDANKAKPPDARTRKYKEVVEENTQLRTQVERVDKLETQFEQYGGVDVVETAMDLYQKLATQPAEVINELPAHQRQDVVKKIFTDALANESNRVFGINSVLKQEFGLTADLDQPRMEKIFEYVAHRLNDDPAEFDAFLSRELEFVNTPERELARVKAENERLKNPQQASQEDTAVVEPPEKFAARMNTVFETFEEGAFANEVIPKFADYGLNVLPTDTPEVKGAKEVLQGAVRSFVCEQMRQAKAFDPLIPFMVSNDTENKFFGQAKGAYDRAMKAKGETLLKAVSRLLGKASPAAPAPADTTATTTTKPAVPGARIPAPGGRTQIPQSKPKPAEGGFRTAMAAAKKNVGIG
jgi:hypothetical protein